VNWSSPNPALDNRIDGGVAKIARTADIAGAGNPVFIVRVCFRVVQVKIDNLDRWLFWRHRAFDAGSTAYICSWP